MMMMRLLLLLLLPHLAAAKYRLQTSSYSLTHASTLELKESSCQKNFGDDAILLDMETVSNDFTVDEFNHLLAGVFFQKQNAQFYVKYGGTDTPPNNDDEKYVVKIKDTSTQSALVQYGDAKLLTSDQNAQVLCRVPIKEYDGDKEYVPPDATGMKQGFSNMFKFSFLAGLVAIAWVAKRKYSDSHGHGGYQPYTPSTTITNVNRNPITQLYYRVLDHVTGGGFYHNNAAERTYDTPSHSAPLAAELSYTAPSVQGLV